MSKIIIIIILFLSTNLYSQNPQINWQITLGGDYIEKFGDMIALEDGSFLVLGATSSLDNSGTVNTNTTTVDYYQRVWLIHLSSNGNIISQKAFAKQNKQPFRGLKLIKSNDGGWLLVCSYYNFGVDVIELLKLDSSYNQVWIKSFSTNSTVDFVSGIQLANNEFAVILKTSGTSGEFNSNPTGEIQNWIFKINTQGITSWGKRVNKIRNDNAMVCSEDPNGEIIVFFKCSQNNLSSIRKVEFNAVSGNITNDKLINYPENIINYNPSTSSFSITKKGLFITMIYNNAGTIGTCIANYDENMSLVFSKIYSIGGVPINKIIDANDGGFYFVGSSQVIYFGKLFSDGNFSWYNIKGSSSGFDGGYTCLETANGDLIIGGVVGGSGISTDVLNFYSSCRTCGFTNMWIVNVNHQSKSTELSPLNNNFLNTFCTNKPIAIHFLTKGNFPKTTIFQAQLSDNNGSFVNPTDLISNDKKSPLTVNIPQNVSPGSNYKLRIIPNGINTSDNVSSIVKITNTTPTSTLNLDSTVRKGEFINLNINFLGGNPYTFKLNDNIFRTAEGNSKLVSFQVFENSIFKVDTLKNSCGFGTSNGLAQIFVENKYCRVPTSNCTSYGINSIEIKKNNDRLYYKGDDYGCVGGYSYNNSNIKLKIDSTYIFNISNYSQYYQTYLKIWIDFDQDSTFNDNELIFFQNELGGTKNGSFLIPSNAKQGKTRMRIRASADNYYGPLFNQCDKFINGETEDLTLIIINHLLCPDVQTQQNNYSNFTGKIEAFDKVQSNKIIENNSNVIFDAGKKILLQNGFEVKNGSTFEARIDGCGGW